MATAADATVGSGGRLGSTDDADDTWLALADGESEGDGDGEALQPVATAATSKKTVIERVTRNPVITRGYFGTGGADPGAPLL